MASLKRLSTLRAVFMGRVANVTFLTTMPVALGLEVPWMLASGMFLIGLRTSSPAHVMPFAM